jgi:hypothetical protein
MANAGHYSDWTRQRVAGLCHDFKDGVTTRIERAVEVELETARNTVNPAASSTTGDFYSLEGRFEMSSLGSALNTLESARNIGVVEPTWTKLTCTLDSGACVSVLPKKLIPEGYSIERDDLNRSYTAAAGQEVVDEGLVRLDCQNEDSRDCSMKFRVTEPDVRRPLVAAGDVCTAGGPVGRRNRVVLDLDSGSYIENKVTGIKTAIRLRNGIFEYDVWTRPRVPVLQSVAPQPGSSVFRRQAWAVRPWGSSSR